MSTSPKPDRHALAPGLEISRLVTGLWQVADMERGGQTLDPAAAASALGGYVEAGFDTFDMADHYGSAELIAGHLRRQSAPGKEPILMTKWVPEPGAMSAEIVRAGVQQRLDRLGVEKIDLLQFHWWSYEHPGYIDALDELARMRDEGLIGHLGLTNFNTDHLRLLLAHGIPLVSNQVSFSLLDRRAAGDMASLCTDKGIGVLAYGTLAGGFLSEKWLGVPESDAEAIADWSKMKYRRFIDAIGGWPALQAVLQALADVARRHDVSIPNVATRWVLEQPAVAAVVVGARPGERAHWEDNLQVFSFALDEADRKRIDDAVQQTKPVPGDCGDEYRRPPFLTASGDLSDHLRSLPRVYTAQDDPSRPDRAHVASGSAWESIGGYARAVKLGDRILVSGTTATHGASTAICPGDAASQTVFILDKIAAALQACEANLADVVRTRVYLRDIGDAEAVARVHGRYFADVRPANAVIEVAGLVPPYSVEIEAEAILQPS